MRFLILVLALTCGSVTAQDSRLSTLQTGHDSKGWEGVGRLDIIGKGFCTAALITDKIILTAAHCIHHDDGTLIPVENFSFEAGLRNGRSEASRDVYRALAHPDYVHIGSNTNTSEIATDIAILGLSQPIRNGRITPYPIADQPRRGDKVGIVSYARERADAPSLQEVCGILGQQNGVLLMSCSIDFGASGAPVFSIQNGVAKIVSVVSAMADVDGTRISLGTTLRDPLNLLMAQFDDVPVGNRTLLQGGQRQDTGAKFLRPSP